MRTYPRPLCAGLYWPRLIPRRDATGTTVRVDRVRRLLLRLVTAAPGGPGSPSVPTMGDCLGWLDAVRTKGGESCLDREGEESSVGARKYGPGDRNRRDGAPRGDAPFAKGATEN